MEKPGEFSYQEGGLRHPDAVPIDITKAPHTVVQDITKITGWWSDEGVLGLEVEHGAISMKGLCESESKAEPPHSASLKMSEGEYFTEIIGQTTGRIERLTFKTSRGTSITFGYDKPGGTSFTLAQKNYRISALTVGIGKQIYFVGAYFTFVPHPSPPLFPQHGVFEEGKESEEFKLDYPKAISYEPPKELCSSGEIKALENPETYGKFNDFDSTIRNPIHNGKKVTIKEIMLYYSAVKRIVLGYRLKYEIRDPTKASGKILELKHVAPNPMTPTLHTVRILDENEVFTKIKGQHDKSTECITYLGFETNLGSVIEAGVKQEAKDKIENFELHSLEGKIIIALSGKVTDALNALGIFCIDIPAKP